MRRERFVVAVAREALRAGARVRWEALLAAGSTLFPNFFRRVWA